MVRILHRRTSPAGAFEVKRATGHGGVASIERGSLESRSLQTCASEHAEA